MEIGNAILYDDTIRYGRLKGIKYPSILFS